MKTLKDVKVGETATVAKLHGEGPVKRRIMDMGITKGVEIYVRPSTYCTSKPSAYSGRMIREESEVLTATPTACVLFLLFCPQETRNNKRQTTGQHFPFSRILLYLLIFYL